MGHTISWNNQYCIVESIFRTGTITGATGLVNGLQYNSEITCRIMTDYERQPHDAEVIVFASTFEEAVSNNINGGGTNMYTFRDASTVPIVNTVTDPEFDLSFKAYKITLAILGSTDTMTTFDGVYIGGKKQTIHSITATEIVVKVDNIDSGIVP